MKKQAITLNQNIATSIAQLPAIGLFLTLILLRLI